jgi:hypothetical protein
MRILKSAAPLFRYNRPYWKSGSVCMPETLTVDLASVVKTLESGGLEPDSDALIQVARMIAKLFAVDADEVAILKVVPKFKSLKFILPERLALVGTIPLSSATALAARTARERRAEVVNNFSTARHANVFEAVPLGRDPSELIQKIMSAPILQGTLVQGVVQISRKAANLSDAGADFSQKDLRTLVSLSPLLERFLKLCHVE